MNDLLPTKEQRPAGDEPLRQLLIGVDAMEWTLVQRWAAQGKLPTFRWLLEEGARAELSTTGQYLPDSVWTTLCYGVNPGKIEKYFYVQYDPATGSLRYAADLEMRGQPFWHYLSEAGRRVGVVDIPHLPFKEVPHGFHLMNWGAHDNKGGAITSPPSLLAEVQKCFGSHPVGDCERYNKDVKSLRRLRGDILRGVATHGELFRWLMTTKPWDVFLCEFHAAHCAGHHFWSYMDPSHPLHEESDPEGLADTVEQTYRAIDREIGEMLEVAGRQTRAFVFAPHGMGPLSHASWNLNEILDLLGFGEGSERRAPDHPSRRGKLNPWRIVKMVVPSKLQYAIKDRLPKRLQDELVFRWYAAGRKYSGRKAFAVPNNEVTGAVRISVRGRDRGGLVEPGPEYRTICNDIKEALFELSDPVTGRPVVKKVTFLHDLCHGPFVEGLPDLSILWDSTFPWDSLESPRFGTLRIRRQDSRSGSHTPQSFLLATGPGVPAGVELEGCSTYDIAPTVLEGAGVPPPQHLDGQAIKMQGVESTA